MPKLDTEHQEKYFESYIVERLVEQGWREGESTNYDKTTALYPDDIIDWLKLSGQAEKWEKLVAHKGDEARAKDALLKRLDKGLNKNGTLHILRKGLSMVPCGELFFSESAPEDLRNETVVNNYRANILRVVRQLRYHPTKNLAIDLVCFINGFPVATIEVKTDFTQSAAAAVEQYRTDRPPKDPDSKRDEPLLTFKRGAVVHFAMSESDIQMTTKLAGEKTYFLPFNQGDKGHKGNPEGDLLPDGSRDYPVAYFWNAVCQFDAWLRIFHSFIYVEKKDVADLRDNWSSKETLIFPRFHQWTAVNAMIDDARKNGAGMTYLAEHSAGSGKTSTISWTAHDLTKLRKDNGEAIFNSVIIVTDRNVLDSQLQEAVRQIDAQAGVIETIDNQSSSVSKSKRLAQALIDGKKMIVVTIQTFPYAMEAIITNRNLKDKNFAVIIDEAHNSQTGSTAAKLQTALGLTGKGNMSHMTVDEVLEKIQQSRARPDNVSYFAFTATPKHSTYMLFGRPTDPTQPVSDDNPPQAFHRYTMRQAIEEGFILDVLQGYMPYQTAYKLSEQLNESKRVGNKSAKRALAKWLALHPTNVTQKVEFIVEHFIKNVSHRLDGKAKAMIVTSSRAAAIRYKKALDAYIAQHQEYSKVYSLVAFSGTVTGKEIMHPDDTEDCFVVDESAEFTETNMNTGAGSSDLRSVFDRPEYRVMIVANKFQTGFDQPKLVAMYVDKKIANDIEIVQTYSRLNRTALGKDEVFIIDFVNEPDSVRQAFAKYDSGAHIEEVQELDIVYDIMERLDEYKLYQAEDLMLFKEARFKTIRTISDTKMPIHRDLYQATDRATKLYNDKMKMLRNGIATWESDYEKARQQGNEDGMKAAEHQQAELIEQVNLLLSFKSDLGKFCRMYAYIAQLIDFGDPELENFAAFAKLLQKRLDKEDPEAVDLVGLVLTGFEIKRRKETEQITGGDPVLSPIDAGGGGASGEKPTFLSEIIKRLNSLFGDVAPLADQIAFANQIADIVRENDIVMAQIENNTRKQAMLGGLPSAVEQSIIRALSSHQSLTGAILTADENSKNTLVNMIYDLLARGGNITLDKHDDV